MIIRYHALVDNPNVTFDNKDGRMNGHNPKAIMKSKLKLKIDWETNQRLWNNPELIILYAIFSLGLCQNLST